MAGNYTEYKIKISVYANSDDHNKLDTAVVSFSPDFILPLSKGDYIQFERIGQRLYFKKVFEDSSSVAADTFRVTMSSSLHTVQTMREHRMRLFMPFRGEYYITHFDKSLNMYYVDLEDVRDYRRVVLNKTNRKTTLLPSVNYISNKENDDMSYVGNASEVVKNDRWVRTPEGRVIKSNLEETVVDKISAEEPKENPTKYCNDTTCSDLENNLMACIQSCILSDRKHMANELLKMLQSVLEG